MKNICKNEKHICMIDFSREGWKYIKQTHSPFKNQMAPDRSCAVWQM